MGLNAIINGRIHILGIIVWDIPSRNHQTWLAGSLIKMEVFLAGKIIKLNEGLVVKKVYLGSIWCIEMFQTIDPK